MLNARETTFRGEHGERETLCKEGRMKADRRYATENAPRDCGSCNVCCTAMRVRPLDKPAGQPCIHQTSRGCGIYHERPGVCREWFCLWVRDTQVFCETHRPDQLGVFFSVSRPDAGGQQRIYAHEIHPGALDRPEPRRVINFLRQFAQVEHKPFREPAEQPATLTIHGEQAA